MAQQQVRDNELLSIHTALNPFVKKATTIIDRFLLSKLYNCTFLPEVML